MEYFLGLNSETNLDKSMISKFSGVGMIRGENLCVNKLEYFTIPSFCNYVTDYLNYVAKTFKDKPVWYRTADLVPHQINNLDGCDAFIEEDQYLIGNRGIRRNLEFIDTYLKELIAYNEAYKNNNNLGLLIPFISNKEEIIKVKELLDKIGYKGKLGIMVEIPSAVIMLDEFNKLGIDYYTIGMNDLTTMVLGAKRDIKAYSINSEAVYRLVDYAIDKIHSFGKKVTVAGYLNPKVLEHTLTNRADAINIHYNEIPIFFDVPDESVYTSQYKELKERYYVRKRERNARH